MTRYRADEHYPYFCTITVLDWIPVFIDQRYIDPIIESLRFCHASKGLELFAYVVMPHHLHLIAAAEDLHATMRDFKRFTSRSVHDLLKRDGRTTLLEWMTRATQRARRGRGELGLWQDGFHPQLLQSHAMFEQKLAYLHENPVRKGLVNAPRDWRFSSAAWYEGERDCLLEMDVLDM